MGAIQGSLKRKMSPVAHVPRRPRDSVAADTSVFASVGHTSRSGRVVKPKVYKDGTEVDPGAGLYKTPFRSQPPPRSSLSDSDGHSSDDDRNLTDEQLMARRAGRDVLTKRGSVPVRDETGRFVGVRPKTNLERLQAQQVGPAGNGGIFKTAAIEVLRDEMSLMTTGEIARAALRKGLIKCSGKTPEATMASALYTDIKRKEGTSIFFRPREGLFGLREWEVHHVEYKDPSKEDGYVPEDVDPSRYRRFGPRSGHGDSDGEYLTEDEDEYYDMGRDQGSQHTASGGSDKPGRSHPSISSGEKRNLDLLLNAVDCLDQDEEREPLSVRTTANGHCPYDEEARSRHHPSERGYTPATTPRSPPMRSMSARMGQGRPGSSGAPRPVSTPLLEEERHPGQPFRKGLRTGTNPREPPQAPPPPREIELLVEGFNAQRLAAAIARQPKQPPRVHSDTPHSVNILQLPMEDMFIVEGSLKGWEAESFDHIEMAKNGGFQSPPARKPEQAAQVPTPEQATAAPAPIRQGSAPTPVVLGAPRAPDHLPTTPRSQEGQNPAANGAREGREGSSSAAAPRLRPPPPTNDQMECLEKNMAALEKQYGNEHPLVGMGYMFLSKVYYNSDSPNRDRLYHLCLDRAQRALRPYIIPVPGVTNPPIPGALMKSFDYLAGKVSLPTPADSEQQPQAAPAPPPHPLALTHPHSQLPAGFSHPQHVPFQLQPPVMAMPMRLPMGGPVQTPGPPPLGSAPTAMAPPPPQQHYPPHAHAHVHVHGHVPPQLHARPPQHYQPHMHAHAPQAHAHTHAPVEGHHPQHPQAHGPAPPQAHPPPQQHLQHYQQMQQQQAQAHVHMQHMHQHMQQQAAHHQQQQQHQQPVPMETP